MRVLIIDDDKAIQDRLTNILKGLGASFVHAASKAEDFTFHASLKSFDLLIVDFLLPEGINGIDLIQKIHLEKTKSNSGVLWMMSGVVKPDSVPQNLKDKIDLFLKKPLDEALISRHFKKIRKSKTDKEEGVFSSFYEEFVPLGQIIKLIEDRKVIDSRELPLLFCLLSFDKFTGILTVLNKKGEKSKLSFLDGCLVSVESPHRRSFFGVLLAEQGLAEVSSIKKFLKEKTFSQGRLGEKLIRFGHLSPHAVISILKEQSRIRISQMVELRSSSVVTLKKESLPGSNGLTASLNLDDLRLILAQILWAKTDRKWLKNFFNLKEDFILHPVPGQKLFKSDVEWLSRIETVIPIIDKKKSLKEVFQEMSELSFTEEESLFYIYYLCSAKFIFMREEKIKKNPVEFKEVEGKLYQFKQRMKKENYFELLSLSEKASDTEIKNRIMNIISVFHPDLYHGRGEPDFIKSCNDVIIFLDQIKQTLLDPDKKKNYLQEMWQGSKKEVLESASVYNKAKQCVDKREYKQALELFKEIKDKSYAPLDSKLYYCLALMKSEGGWVVKNNSQNKKIMDQTFYYLNRASLEDQHSALYLFVKALYFLRKGEHSAGKKLLKNCLDVDSGFLLARMEIENMKNSEKTNLFRRFFKTG